MATKKKNLSGKAKGKGLRRRKDYNNYNGCQAGGREGCQSGGHHGWQGSVAGSALGGGGGNSSGRLAQRGSGSDFFALSEGVMHLRVHGRGHDGNLRRTGGR